MFGIVIFFSLLGSLAAGITLMATKKLMHFGRVLVLVPIIFSVAILLLILTLILFMTTANADFYAIMSLIFAIIVIAVSVFALWGMLKRKYIYIPISICLSVAILVTSGGFVYYGVSSKIKDNITVTENDDLLPEYSPYAEGSKVAELDEESDLIIDSQLPKMDGATALYPVYSAFANAVYPKEFIDDIIRNDRFVGNEYLTCSTTSFAYEKIVNYEADIIFVAAPSEAQKTAANKNGVELVYTPIGKEAFVFFVNSKNPINDISLEQIQDIYSGKTTRWSDLGVKGFGDIRAFQREEGSGSQTALISIMGEKKLIKPPTEDTVDGMGGIIEKTSDYKNYKNAIGYSFRFYSTEMVKSNQIKLLKVNGIEPNIENIENGKYPLASYFYAVTRKDMSPNTEKLLQWIQGKQGQELIKRTGYTIIKE